MLLYQSSIQLWKGQRNNKPILNYFYTISKHTISACETVHFSLRNGPFGILKRTVLERKMACIRKPLIINVVQRWNKTQSNIIYFYILLPVFNYLSRLISNNVDYRKNYKFFSFPLPPTRHKKIPRSDSAECPGEERFT